MKSFTKYLILLCVVVLFGCGFRSKEEIAAINLQADDSEGFVIVRNTFVELEGETNPPSKEYISKDWKNPSVSKIISNTTYDKLFKDYASCAGLDWRILKAVAYKESSLRASVVNGEGYIGLFQTTKANCKSALKKWKWVNKCNNLKNPSNNTAFGMASIDIALKQVKRRCPNSTLRDKLALVYLVHNTGIGALTKVMKAGGCTKATIKPLFIDYFKKKGKPTKGAQRFRYSYGVADLIIELGLTSLKSNKNGVCPK